jgi:hypothetical protein
MRWNGLSRKAGDRMRVGRRTISVPGVPSMTDPDGPTEASGPTNGADRPSLIDRKAVQYLDLVRAIFRPMRSYALASTRALHRQEDLFRHVGTADMGGDGAQPMMQCPSCWPDGTSWVPICDLEILEDQDVRAG